MFISDGATVLKTYTQFLCITVICQLFSDNSGLFQLREQSKE